MMLNFEYLVKKYQIEIKGIIQLGTHDWQERDLFVKMGIKDFVLIEPQKKHFENMQAAAKGLNAICINCAVSDSTGWVEMNISNNDGMSSSLLEPKEHLSEYPSIKFNENGKEKVYVDMLCNIDFDRSKYNVLVMDLQGNELKALEGADSELLKCIDAIYTEINLSELYENCVQLDELDEFLSFFNFKRVETGNVINNWSDAFYVKNTINKPDIGPLLITS